ncbi:Proton gradient regulation 5 [Melia azedarach]|uniref:Proton gradient regulation 5 n=1 Tax=Melia azedarach TaxID=155640 RepID=A0ACC1YHU4_MELAZ|nr:Proton gradient regulation 5 [Melia azedarach]
MGPYQRNQPLKSQIKIFPKQNGDHRYTNQTLRVPKNNELKFKPPDSVAVNNSLPHYLPIKTRGSQVSQQKNPLISTTKTQNSQRLLSNRNRNKPSKTLVKVVVFVCVSMAASICATGFKGGLGSSFHGSWGSSIAGEEYPMLVKSVSVPNVRVGKGVRLQPMMKNVNEGKGLFAPLVVVTRNIIGKKRFNQIRGKAIALHSQVITEFCKSIGADAKQRQGLIRLAKKNGERLGFLA